MELTQETQDEMLESIKYWLTIRGDAEARALRCLNEIILLAEKDGENQ